MFANTKKLYAALVTAGAIAAAPMAQAAVTFNFTATDSSGVYGSVTLDIAASGQSWANAQILDFEIFGGTHFNGLQLTISKTSVLTGAPGIDNYSGSGTATWSGTSTSPFGAGNKLTAEESDKDFQPVGGDVAKWDNYFYKVILTDNTLKEELDFTYCTDANCTSSEEGFLSPQAYSIKFAPVPIPAALPLFASALVGLGVIARRRKSA